MGAVAEKLRMSEDDSLGWESRAREKHEYIAGEIFAMAGACDRRHRPAREVAALSGYSQSALLPAGGGRLHKRSVVNAGSGAAGPNKLSTARILSKSVAAMPISPWRWMICTKTPV